MGVAVAAGLSEHEGGVKIVRSNPNSATPVVVELFTSEGCSDCPSADAVLANFTRHQPLSDVHVIALGEHVDYWNNRQWKDPFSSAAFSQRQGAYATAFRNAQVYTPQMVVDGKAEFVGSDKERATGEISRAASVIERSHVNVSLEAQKKSADQLSVSVKVRGLTQDAAQSDVYVAVTEDGLSSQVKGGENGGRHLDHAAVVRSLTSIGRAAGSGGLETFAGTLPLAPGASLAKYHVVAFVQRSDAGAILGGADAGLGTL